LNISCWNSYTRVSASVIVFANSRHTSGNESFTGASLLSDMESYGACSGSLFNRTAHCLVVYHTS
jgi:hypothetical protein